MSVNVRLETERGECVAELEDPDGALGRVLSALETGESRYWRFIDPYGDTVFNRLQMEPFLIELDAIERRHLADTVVRQWLAGLEPLARRCRDEVHLYLKFLGD
jgi:hypothetical protein